ncbi:hypothetical protein ACH4E5_02265 [Streptomyces afghaniensis]|uniref:hypothetical protein n=1 Tax=Streptomyces afghaniensis TaxID=66865 RepID=UPI0037A70FB6
MTNSHGVAWNAGSTCKELIGRFDGLQAAFAVRSFANSKIRLKLVDKLPREKCGRSTIRPGYRAIAWRAT